MILSQVYEASGKQYCRRYYTPIDISCKVPSYRYSTCHAVGEFMGMTLCLGLGSQFPLVYLGQLLILYAMLVTVQMVMLGPLE